MIQLTSDSTDSTFWQSIFSLFQFKWKNVECVKEEISHEI